MNVLMVIVPESRRDGCCHNNHQMERIYKRESAELDLCDVMMDRWQTRWSAITDRQILNVHIAMTVHNGIRCNSAEVAL